MTQHRNFGAWALEVEGDLFQDRGGITELLIDAWIDLHHLPAELHSCTENTIRHGRTPGSLDSVFVPGEATREQVDELATWLERAFNLWVVVRRAELLLISTVDRDTMEPTGQYQCYEVGGNERAKRRREQGGRDVN